MDSQNDGCSWDTIVPGNFKEAFAATQNVFSNANGYGKGPTTDLFDLINESNFDANGYVKDPENLNFVESNYEICQSENGCSSVSSFENVNGHEKGPTIDFDDLLNYMSEDSHQLSDHPTSPSSSTASDFERMLNSMETSIGSNNVEQKRSLEPSFPLESEVTDSNATPLETNDVNSPLTKENRIEIGFNLTAPEIKVTSMLSSLEQQDSISSSDRNQQESFLHSTQQMVCVKTRRRRNAKCSSEIERKKAERRTKNNMASRELRARRKEDTEKLINKEIEMELENKELRNKVKYLEGGINEILSVLGGISGQLIQNSIIQFRENFLNLIRLQDQANNSGDTTFISAIEKLLQVYQNQIERTMGDQAKSKLLRWLKWKLNVSVSW